MNRRQIIQSTMLATGAFSTGLASVTTTSSAAFAAAPNWKDVAEKAAHCFKVGEICLKHCEEQLKQGNKKMADCHAAVSDMLVACDAIQKLASRGSKHAAAYAKACAKVCADCAAACEPHAKNMKECADCETACKDCEKSCNASA